MVSMLLQFILHMLNIAILQSIGGGANIITTRCSSQTLLLQKKLQEKF